MTEDFSEVNDGLLGLLRQASATITEAARPERFEYLLALWQDVNDLARDGWRMVPGSAHPIPVTWKDPDTDADMQGARTAYVMERKLGPESEAEEILRGVREGTIPVVEYANEVGQEPDAT